MNIDLSTDSELPPVDADRELEQQSIAAADELVRKPPANNPGLWLVISLVLFVLSQARSFDWKWMLILIGVLFFHELGHYLGMTIFGYRDVRMFFIPFFGAAVSGKKHAAPAWQELIVLLLGPLPGILLAGAVYFGWRPQLGSTLMLVTVMLVVLNAFQLLPVLPLDGGRVVHILIFRRHPVLELLFRIGAVVALAGLAIVSLSWLMGLLAVWLLIGVSFHYRVAHRAGILRRHLPGLSKEWDNLGPAERHELFLMAVDLLPMDRKPESIALRMQALHTAAAATSPGVLATLLFLCLYFGAIIGTPLAGTVGLLQARDAAIVALEAQVDEVEQHVVGARESDLAGERARAEQQRVEARAKLEECEAKMRQIHKLPWNEEAVRLDARIARLQKELAP